MNALSARPEVSSSAAVKQAFQTDWSLSQSPTLLHYHHFCHHIGAVLSTFLSQR